MNTQNSGMLNEDHF